MPACRSASTCDVCGSLRGGSGTVEIEPGNDALVAAREAFRHAEQGIAADYLPFVRADEAVKAAVANRDAPLAHSFAAKTMPSVVQIMLNQGNVAQGYALNIESAVLGTLRFWAWALHHGHWDGAQAVIQAMDWQKAFYVGVGGFVSVFGMALGWWRCGDA